MEQQRARARSPTVDADELAPDAGDKHRQFAQTAAFVAGSSPASAPSVELTTGASVGEYVIERKIGEGAMGTVYRAVHPAIGKQVAIKVMTPRLFDEPEAVKRFVAEARAVAAIRHPGIVDVFGFGRLPDGRTYLVMEWLDGKSLDARHARRASSTLEEALRRSCARSRARSTPRTARASSTATSSPRTCSSSTSTTRSRSASCSTSGSRRSTNEDDGLVAKTRTGQLLGTPLYMCPEQCKSQGRRPPHRYLRARLHGLRDVVRPRRRSTPTTSPS